MEFTKGSTWTHSTQFTSKISAISHKRSDFKTNSKRGKKPIHLTIMVWEREIETEFLYEAQVGLELAL